MRAFPLCLAVLILVGGCTNDQSSTATFHPTATDVPCSECQETIPAPTFATR